MKKQILIPVCLMAGCLALGVPDKGFAAENYVFDQAEILSSGEEQTLNSLANELAGEYKMNFVILTTDDARGKSSEAYADDFYMDYGFYDDGKCGGAIYLIDMDNRRVQLETAGDMKDLYITDRRVDGIIDAGYDYVKSGDYMEAFEAMLDATAQYIEDGIVSGKYTYNEDTGEYKVLRRITWQEALIAFVIALAAGGAACAAVAGKYRLRWGAYEYPFREKSSLQLTVKRDEFMGQHIRHRHIEQNHNQGGGGGDSGATTTHNSSGGGNFGGGGRNF